MSGENDAIDFGDIDLSDLSAADLSEDSESSSSEDQENESEEQSAGEEENDEISAGDDSSIPGPGKAEKEKEKESPSKEKLEKGEKAPKFIQAEVGGKKIDLDPNAELSIKIDGKSEKVKLQDIVNGHSGKIAYDRKFQELGEDKRKYNLEKLEFEQEQTELLQRAKTFASRAKAGDAMGALEILAELAGADPLQTVKEVKSQMLKLAENYAKMSEDQRKSVDLEDTVRYYQKKSEIASEVTESRKVQQENEAKLQTFQKNHNVSDAQLIEMYDNLRQAKNGEVSVADIEDFHLGKQSSDRASKLLTSISPDLSFEGNVKIVANFIRQNPGVSEKHLAGMIKEEIGFKDPAPNPKKSSAQKIVSDRARKNAPNAKYAEEASDDDDDIVSFDQIKF